ncbi:S-adenosyl-L-methionine-dependent methyltransferases superfamily protein [Actinidia rufa]|uniref:Methyltransferase n=1 Tax=Actinidia rufa TaxID=165716 RepID=A0A7J0GU15_9ERIC|nr:S-adenosyl-L-methionine-dependent methyltransferases superfamily protein [Actinidia rufa]
MRGRSDGGQKIRLITSRLIWAAKQDESSSKFGLEDGEDGIIPKSFPVCDACHSELIPCLDRNLIYQMRLKLDLALMEHYERHCPPPERRYNCLIPPPQGYKIPIKWPRSRDEVWKANIPHTHLAHEKSDQNWMVVKGEKNRISWGRHSFSLWEGYEQFLMLAVVFASFGAYLLSSDIIAMSLAPNDVHQNQIQFALERGIPAYLGVLGTKEASLSKQIIGCSGQEAILPTHLLKHMLRMKEDLRIWREMSALVERMCWKIASKKNQTVIWVKPLTNDCYMEREPGTQPPLCRTDDDPDAVWGVQMEPCITPYSDQVHKTRGSGLAPWPHRLTSPPPRLADFGYSNEIFEKDTELWHRRVENYWNLLSPKVTSDTLRNLMDMKANLGSFGAALKEKNVWVMNVVPEDGPNTLKLIYDRGLIGTVHNWCEAFSTYPRTYDLLHAWTVFSDIEKKGCSAEDLLLEMDRMLRPTGFIIIRDKQPVIEFVKKYLPALHWEAVATVDFLYRFRPGRR